MKGNNQVTFIKYKNNTKNSHGLVDIHGKSPSIIYCVPGKGGAVDGNTQVSLYHGHFRNKLILMLFDINQPLDLPF